jgi:hypothetical protein
VSLFDLVFRDHVLEAREIKSSVKCKECNAVAKVSTDNLEDYAIEFWVATYRNHLLLNLVIGLVPA